MTTETPKIEVEKPKKPGPAKFAVIDLEGSGLRLKDADDRLLGHETYGQAPHRPGVDHACILEVGVVIVDATTLKEEVRQSWLVLPPGVRTEEQFDAWALNLKEKDAFVFDMHSKQPMGVPSLLDELRALAASKNKPEKPLAWVEQQVVEFLRQVSTLPAPPRLENGDFDWSKLHPGNSDLMFAGNSIANYDIPMLKHWMPEVLKTLSYRIMDVSVLRTFYTEIARVALPAGLDEMIRSGGNENHRAMDDCEHCADALRWLVTYARNANVGADLFTEAEKVRAALEYAKLNVETTPKDVAARVAHLEMLVRYGSRRAIKEERKFIEARDDRSLWVTRGSALEAEEDQGLFRKQGGILRAKPSDVADSFSGGDNGGDDGEMFSSFGNGSDRL